MPPQLRSMLRLQAATIFLLAVAAAVLVWRREYATAVGPAAGAVTCALFGKLARWIWLTRRTPHSEGDDRPG